MSTVDEIRAYLAELPPHHKYLSSGDVKTAAWLRTLLAENARMAAVVEAARELEAIMEWYANDDNYVDEEMGDYIDMSPIADDTGVKARKALRAYKQALAALEGDNAKF